MTETEKDLQRTIEEARITQLIQALRERGRGDIEDGYEDKTERGQLDLEVADSLESLLKNQLPKQ